MEIRRHFVLKDDKNTTNQNLYDAGKVMLSRFFIELNVYIKKKKGLKNLLAK